ncbi:MAG TPA: EAL domain-containing protein [Rhodocyclaceae bacterium]|nr:EAL domain-containing protein [Rhodocyclaceae bacterium]
MNFFAASPRRPLVEHWPWLLGMACTLVLDLLQPFALQQLTFYFYQHIVTLPLAADRPLPLPLSLLLSLGLVLLPLPLSRRQGAGTAFLICSICMALPLAVGWILLQNGIWYAPFAAIIGLWIGASFNFARQLRQTQRKLLRIQRHAEATLSAIADGVMNVAPDGTIRTMNPVATLLAEISNGRIGQHISVAFGLPGQTARQLEELISQCASEGRTVRAEPHLSINGRQMRVTAGPIFDSESHVEEVVLALTDISETVAAHKKLFHDANHDPLTGLPSRGLLIKRIAEAISHAMQHDGLAAVLFIDIDHFNRINDSLGHYIGDAILAETARRLVKVIGDENRVSRWGGDEYVVLLDQADDRESLAVIAQKILTATSAPLNINGLTLHVTCSLGISLTPNDSINVDELLAMADTAMARSKTEIEGAYRFFSSSMNLWSHAHMDIETDLRSALQKNEFDLYFQPQVEIATGKLIGMEALLRWARPGKELVPPDHFIPVAEEIGLIIDIGVWAIYRAAQQLKKWTAAGLPIVPLAVNISARQCLDHRITKVIADAMQHTGIDPSMLKIELTEATAMNNVDHVASLLRGVHGLGVRISVDDFGTGYSSLSFLKRFPISQLKIDRSFVHDITIDEDDAAIVSGTIALAHGLGIEVVAEGVETQEQLAFLAARGCDIAQGFYFSHPLTEEAAREYLLHSAQIERDYLKLQTISSQLQ